MPSAEVAPGRTMTSAGRDAAAGTATPVTSTSNRSGQTTRVTRIPGQPRLTVLSIQSPSCSDKAASSGQYGPAHLETEPWDCCCVKTSIDISHQAQCFDHASDLGVCCCCVSASAVWLQGVRRLFAAC